MIENIHEYKVYYNGTYACNVMAHTKYEAVDRFYYRYAVAYPYLERNKIKVFCLV